MATTDSRSKTAIEPVKKPTPSNDETLGLHGPEDEEAPSPGKAISVEKLATEDPPSNGDRPIRTRLTGIQVSPIVSRRRSSHCGPDAERYIVESPRLSAGFSM